MLTTWQVPLERLVHQDQQDQQERWERRGVSEQLVLWDSLAPQVRSAQTVDICDVNHWIFTVVVFDRIFTFFPMQ